MQTQITKIEIINSLTWKFFERIGTQIIQFIIQIVMARLLMPQDYGVLAIILVLIDLANVFINTGFNSALVQKKDTDDSDFHAVLLIELIIVFIFISLLFIIAPHIAIFYNIPLLTPTLRTMSLILLPGAINSIQIAYASKKMQFKKLFYGNLGATLFSGILGIALAYNGYGVWSLVFQQLVRQIITTITLSYLVNWSPRLEYSPQKICLLFSFGWKVLVGNIIESLYSNIYNLTIGKLYNPDILGFYNRGQQFPLLIFSNIDVTIQTVLFPVLASEQNNLLKVKLITKKSITLSSFLIMPLMGGLIITAKPLVLLLLTEKWLPCVPFVQLTCLYFAFLPIQSANNQAIYAIGRSDIALKLVIIKKSIGILALFLGLPFGVYVLVGLMPIVGALNCIANIYPNTKLLNYSYSEQINDVLPSIMLTIVMSTIIFCIYFFKYPPLLTFALQTILGLTIYIIGAYVFKIKIFFYILLTLKKVLK